MHIGLTYTLKPAAPLPAGAPDDLHEEFDSPVTVQAIAEALQSLGHTTTLLGDGPELLAQLLGKPPEFLFNIAEGTGVSRNRESRVPAVAEMLGIPCTGSDALTLGLALDKGMTRRILADTGVSLPKGVVLAPQLPYEGDHAEFAAILEANDLTLPVIAKPVCEGSSKGIRNRCLIQKIEDFGPTVVELWTNYRQAVLVEEFISGEEVTIGIIGNDPPEVLGAMRVVPNTPSDTFVYSLEVKRNWEELVTYECPPKLPGTVLRTLEESALAVYESMGCRDIARLDYRIRDGVPYFIEVNPLPGLNPITSDLNLICKAMNVTHTELIGRIFDAAVGRSDR